MSFTIKLGRGVALDARTLVDTRMLITGNSGAGKSYTLRLIAEQAAPKLQTIILDPEGEYATLREKVDVVLVGSGGEVKPEVRNAPRSRTARGRPGRTSPTSRSTLARATTIATRA